MFHADELQGGGGGVTLAICSARGRHIPCDGLMGKLCSAWCRAPLGEAVYDGLSADTVGRIAGCTRKKNQHQ